MKSTVPLTPFGPLLAILAACAASAESDRDLEFIHAPITALDELDDGAVAIGLEPMARAFVIHPELSPDAPALVAFAEQQRTRREPVYVTVWIRAKPQKRPPRGLDPVAEDERWPFVIVRLADTPDPRAH